MLIGKYRVDNIVEANITWVSRGSKEQFYVVSVARSFNGWMATDTAIRWVNGVLSRTRRLRGPVPTARKEGLFPPMSKGQGFPEAAFDDPIEEQDCSSCYYKERMRCAYLLSLCSICLKVHVALKKREDAMTADLFEDAERRMQKAVSDSKHDISAIRAGRASVCFGRTYHR